MEMLKVSARSNPKAVAGALAATIRKHGTAQLQAIGAGALNQTVKAIAIARGYVAPNGYNLVFIPTFVEISMGTEERTAIKFIVGSR